MGQSAPVCLFLPFQRLFRRQTRSQRHAGWHRARAARLRAGSPALDRAAGVVGWTDASPEHRSYSRESSALSRGPGRVPLSLSFNVRG
jgi:hypothetical protein